jgi:hypothetical protein
VVETGQPYAYTGDDPVNGVDPLGLLGCSSLGFLGLSSDCHKAVNDLKPLAHEAVHVADNVRRFVAVHRRGLEQIGIGVAAIAISVACAETCGGLVASVVIGAISSVGSYTAGCAGTRIGCNARDAVESLVAGGLAGGLGGELGSLCRECGAVGLTAINVGSGATVGGAATFVDDRLDRNSIGAGGFVGAGLGSLSGATGTPAQNADLRSSFWSAITGAFDGE